MSLLTAPTARRMRVTSVRNLNAASYRLMEMGLIEGAEVTVLRRAPLGDPMHVRVGDSELSLRNADAESIDVAPF